MQLKSCMAQINFSYYKRYIPESVEKFPFHFAIRARVMIVFVWSN